MLLARVAVPVPLGQAFSYRVEPELAGEVVRGARVLCDFGRRRVLGVVLDVEDREPDVDPAKLRPVRAVVGDEPVLGDELLAFLVEVARYYVAPIGEVMRLALPAVERRSTRALGGSAELGSARVREVGGRLVQSVGLVAGQERPALRGQAASIVEHLERHGSTLLADLTQSFPNARAAVKRLGAAGVVQVALVEAPPPRSRFSGPVARDVPPELTAAQASARDEILASLEAGRPSAFLLHGVTASGKTEVYLRAAARCLERGSGAIVLVPEIALTPQLVARFRARLGDAVAVLHSGLTQRDRHSMWCRLRSGELRIAVGARSALFAPVQDLRLVCVDEEHDPSFKQEDGVRYHGRDMALLRAHRAGAVCVLGSATPSLESVALARQGRLRRLMLPDRARSASALPKVEIIDLRRTGPGPTDERLLSLPLHRALESVLGAGEQAILFLNRRGFAPSIVCDECGTVAECEACSVALTYHRARHVVRCHYCDFEAPFSGRCAKCKSDRVVQEGAGTERIEGALLRAFPAARVARLDRDVAGGARSEPILERMRRREIDVLVGTQMVTKGHDLPAVTLVGVLNADAALSMPDFRAAERTFQLLVQVAGRAGRGETPGTVLVQTRLPDHAAVVLATQHDVLAFVEGELAERRELGYPPFAHLALVRTEAIDEGAARDAADALARTARRAIASGVEVLGPAPSPIARLKNRWRFRFMLRSAERKAMRPALLAVARAQVDRRVRVVLDVDPVSML